MLSATAAAVRRRFRQVDHGDWSCVRKLDVLVDIPGILVIARYAFSDGYGYEVTVGRDRRLTPGELDILAEVTATATLMCVAPGALPGGGRTLRLLYWQHAAARAANAGRMAA